MTTVVCNREEMSCDRQFTNPDGTKWKGNTKIYKFDPHPLHFDECKFIVGFAGTASEIIEYAAFFSRPEDFKKPRTKGCWGLVLTEQGEIYKFDSNGIWIEVNEPFDAIGSGSAIALGAMATKATPAEAIRIASKIDSYTGMGVKTLRF